MDKERKLIDELIVAPIIPCNQCRNVYVIGQYTPKEEVAAAAKALGWTLDEPFGALCPRCSKAIDI